MLMSAPCTPVVPFVYGEASSVLQPTELPKIAGGFAAPPDANDEAHGSAAAPFVDVENLNRIAGPADEVVRVAGAYDGRGHDEAAAGAAAWTANFKQDFAWRQAMILEMHQGGQAYSEEETALIAKGLALFDSLAAAKGKVRPLKHSKTVTSAWTKRDKKTGLLIGHVEATIRASPEQIIAYQMHYDSKIKLS